LSWTAVRSWSELLPTAVGRFRGNANSRKLRARRIDEFTP
jgi:hypothetical protein